MQKRAGKAKRRRKAARRPDEQTPASHEHMAQARQSAADRRGPFYKAGPALHLDASRHDAQHDESAETMAARQPEPAPSADGRGRPQRVSVYGGRTSLSLRGRTDADYDGGAYHTEAVVARPAHGCSGCARGTCFHITGRLVATYRVTTRVTLPSVNDYPDLTACQRERVQRAIDDVLAPHEQEHVRRFEQYNGTTRRRFDLTICRDAFEGAIQAMFEAEAAERRRRVQAASDALDPFHFTVDLNCEDQRRAVTPAAPADSEA